MKKQIFLSLIVITAILGSAQCMEKQEKTPVKKINEFNVSAHNLQWSETDQKEHLRNEVLRLIKPNHSKPRMFISEIIKEALGKELKPINIGDNQYGSAILDVLKQINVTEDGELDCYDAVHTLRDHRDHFKRILQSTKPKTPVPTPHTRDTSGSSIFSWIKPTFKYGSVILGTYSLVRLWDFYRTK